ARLDIEALALERPEEHLDEPALAIPFDDLERLRGAEDGVAGEQAPVDWRLAGRQGAHFAHVDDVETHVWRQIAAAQIVRALKRDAGKPQLHRGDAGRALARPRRHEKIVAAHGRQAIAI